MGKIMNEPQHIVLESLRGFARAHCQNVELWEEHKIVYRRDIRTKCDQQVSVISGGGSGHEPAHAGYVGEGMLAAAVCGDVFASPSASQVHAAIRLVAGKAGVLVVVMNYTGDRLQFGRACERAKAEGIPVEMVIVADDFSIPDASQGAGRRGIAGSIFALKVAGAAASLGYSLVDVARIVRETSAAVGTVGVALSPCTLPGRHDGSESRPIHENEMEVGLGIHGETGLERCPLKSSREIAQLILDKLMKGLQLVSGQSASVLVNNLGGASALVRVIIGNGESTDSGKELGVLVHDTVQFLESKGIVVRRVLSGHYMTALEMAGASISLLKHAPESTILELLDKPAFAPAWKSIQGSDRTAVKAVAPHESMVSPARSRVVAATTTDVHAQGNEAVHAFCSALVNAEPRLTEYDTIVGDADCGLTLKQGAEAVLQALQRRQLPLSAATPANHFLTQLSHLVEASMGGTSGAIYCIFLDGAASYLARNPKQGSPLPLASLTASEWIPAFSYGIQKIQEYGGAKRGDRTMLDAMLPIVECLQSAPFSWKLLQEAAKVGMEEAMNTANIFMAKAGRSSSLAQGSVLGIPDPGFAIAFQAMAESLVKNDGE